MHIPHLILCAKLSEAVYPADDSIDVYSQKPLIEAAIKELIPDALSVTLSRIGDVDFAVAHTPECAWVIYRGTEVTSPADIMVDLDARMMEPAWANGWKCATGFYGAFSKTINTLLGLIGEQKNVRLTGHSMGASLIQLAGLYLKEKAGKNILSVTTLCGPRLFNESGATHYNLILGSVTTRVVDVLDPVPLMLPYTMGYRHTEDPIYLVGDRIVEELTTKARLVLLIKGAWLAVRTKGIQTGQVHKLSSIIRKLSGHNAI
jgi:hypothetical protein